MVQVRACSQVVGNTNPQPLGRSPWNAPGPSGKAIRGYGDLKGRRQASWSLPASESPALRGTALGFSPPFQNFGMIRRAANAGRGAPDTDQMHLS